MGTRYITKPRQIRWSDKLEWELPDLPSLTVFEDDDPVSTGVLDEQGNEIFRVNEREPIGFRVKRDA